MSSSSSASQASQAIDRLGILDRTGDPALRAEVEQILVYARSRRDDRLEQLAERFLGA